MPRKVLFASDTSGHTAGYQAVLAGLRDGGFEVVSIGYAEPASVAEAALQEGVDAIGYRVMDRDAAVLGESLLRELSKRGLGDVPLVIGGIVQREIRTRLSELGVRAIFGPGSKLSEITDFLRKELGSEPAPENGGRVDRQGAATGEATTTSGIALKPVYTHRDLAGFDPDRDLGLPGRYPFTRGVSELGYRARKWTVRQVMGVGTAEETNERLRYLIEQGQTGVSLTGMGYAPFESSDPRSEGLIGVGGVWIDTLADIETAFDGIDLERISINQTGNSIPVLCMIAALAENRAIPLPRLSGTVQNYVLPWGDPPDLRGNHYVDIIEFCARELPRWNHTSISVRNTRETGISAAQEIAFGLFQGVYTIQAALARGVAIDAFAPRLSFFLNAESDFLEEVAKFRAMRRAWARMLRERFGAKDDRSCWLRFHVQTSGVSLTEQQPLVNLVRATLHTLAAVAGGAQSLSVNAFDEALAIPTPFSQTLAIRTQQVIALESGITRVVDPFGGSYAIEVLTDELERRAQAILAKLESMEGEQAWRWMSDETHRAAYRRQLEIDSGRRTVIGVNAFVSDGDQELGRAERGEALKPDPAWRSKQIARLERVKRERDPRAVEAARRRLVDAYRARDNIVSPTREAVKAYMSIGEIVDALSAAGTPEELRKRGGFVLRLYGRGGA
ncbi:MAG TPA: methylmalonyl-CoA mutase family protein [Candidatus Binatia bacterium]|nr:methylmalonyl-CoA mutase family protein [Candidatus Binatia bacterium]